MQQADLDSTQADAVGTLVIAADDAKRLCAMARAIAALRADSPALRPLATACASTAQDLSEAIQSTLQADEVGDVVGPAHARMEVVAALFMAIRDLDGDDHELRRTLAQQCIDDLDVDGFVANGIDLALERVDPDRLSPSERAELTQCL